MFRHCLRSFSSLRSILPETRKQKCDLTRSKPSRRQVRVLAAFKPSGWENSNVIRCLSSVPSNLNVHAHVIDNGAAVIVSFDDDTQSTFHSPWLLANDPSWVHPTSGQRLRTPGRCSACIMTDASIVNASSEESQDGVVLPLPPPPKGSVHPVGNLYETGGHVSPRESHLLRVTWKSVGRGDSTVSYYDLEWLRHWRYDQEALDLRRAQTRVSTRQTLHCGTEQKGRIPILDYNLIETDKEEFAFQLLHAVFQMGAALVQNAPIHFTESSAPVAVVGRLLAGSLSHGALYGDTFHVKSEPNAINIAYTPVPLSPHQDLAYYESKPGLQFLHCLSNKGVKGGESVLIDAMAAAEEFRRIAPMHFETLTKCSATFVKQREGADMIYRRPHIVVDDFGNVVTVNWSPPFEGPLCLPPNSIVAYYRAYAAFERMLDNSLPPDYDDEAMQPNQAQSLREYANKYTWEQRLDTGEMLVFSNLRMLHGRRGFSFCGDGGGRHLMGCYTNIDDTLNRYRVLLRDRCSDVSVLSAGNGSSGVR